MPIAHHPSLASTLVDVRRRLLKINLAVGAGWAMIAAALFLLAWMWLDLALELTPALRVLASAGAILLLVLIPIAAVSRHLKSSLSLILARRLDRVAGTGGQILTGVDLAEAVTLPVSSAALSSGLAALAIERASALAAGVSRPSVVPLRPLYAPMLSVSGIALTSLIFAIAGPRLASTQWARFTDPYGDHPPYSRMEFEVKPGNVRVVYGDGLDVRAMVTGGVPERLDLVLPDGPTGQELLPMFPEPGGTWRATVANVTSRQHYFVRAGRARSHRYSVDILAVPRFEEVVFRVMPPAYTRQSAYEGPLPQGGLAGLPRTRVEVRAKSNRPLKGGEIRGLGFKAQGSAAETKGAGESATGREGGESTGLPVAVNGQNALVSLHPGSEPNVVVGEFEMVSAGKADIRLVDIEGQTSSDTCSFPITLLRDERPFVRILEPPAEALATPDASLPVNMSAEDDYGISRLQLFRSLNESRPLPMDVVLPEPRPARFIGSAVIDLARCGVEPGDVIKLFARVEDNDPDGAKGSESSVVIVRIIAQDDYEKLLRTREGIEVMNAKYQQANRHLEALLAEMEKLQKEIDAQEPGSSLAREQREKLADLAKQAEQAAHEIAKAARKQLPYDLDKQLSPQLNEVSAKMSEAADELDRIAAQQALSCSGASDALKKLARKLGGTRETLNKQANEPLEYLSAIYPIKEDESLFVAIYMRQRDLEQRLASLKGKDAVDDPELKKRMRDLEEEQGQIREALNELLDKIEEHVARLPEDHRLDDLRNTASQFARAVRASGADQALTDAESGLAEFSGTRGYENAKKGADILEKFVGQCKGVGDQASSCLKFNPNLGSSLGSTVQQLLDEAGLIPGMGSKPGTGMGGGQSARRSSLQNIGLYGNLPTTGNPAQSGADNRSQRTARGGGGGHANDPQNPSALGSNDSGQSLGGAGIDVPLQYRKKVGDYFERIADEIGDESKNPRNKRK